jgi:tetratricopeptide (TPR) repeat protein
MKKIVLSLFVCFLLSKVLAQDVAEMQSNAKTFTKQGDYANAIIILNKAVKMQPSNIELIKDLALDYYFIKDTKKALETIKPTFDRDDVDDQCYQIAGNIYQADESLKECEKLYKKGIKKFPNSGPLYNDFGELLWAQKDYSAIKMWEKGIEMHPNFSKNYFNACKFYYFSTDKVWSIIYGEIFLNQEPMSSSSAEVKNILLESYKKLFASSDTEKPAKENSEFTNAFLQTVSKQNSVLSAGINTESLTMVRTRFILDWYEDYGTKFPFRLFELQRQLLQEGMFDAYNQWIFTASQNLPAYQNWANAHSNEYTELTRFQKGRIFKLIEGQYYK